MTRVLAAPDKFRGSATAREVAIAIAQAAQRTGARCEEHPLADGGEGTLEALGGPNRTSLVTGPAGRPVTAQWRLHGGTAVIEMARAAGLELAGGAAGNDAVAATTRGVGELVLAAITAGARTVIVGVGGSATTDGGWGAIDVLAPYAPFGPDRGVDVVVAADVTTTYVEAATVFAPQKGATPEDVILLRRRLEARQQELRERYGVNLSAVPGTGAAGGLAGGLHALGARIEPGFDVVAERTGLDVALDHVDVVVTGEGKLDAGSFRGKVVGGVTDRARERGLPVLAVVGDAEQTALPDGLEVLPLLPRYGDRAWSDPLGCVRDAVSDWLAGKGGVSR